MNDEPGQIAVTESARLQEAVRVGQGGQPKAQGAPGCHLAAQPLPAATGACATAGRPQMGCRVRLQLLQPHPLCRPGEWGCQLLCQLPGAGEHVAHGLMALDAYLVLRVLVLSIRKQHALYDVLGTRLPRFIMLRST